MQQHGGVVVSTEHILHASLYAIAFACALSRDANMKAWAINDTYEARVEAVAEDDGTVLRAPTENQGLIPLCKDTFRGTVSSCRS